MRLSFATRIDIVFSARKLTLTCNSGHDLKPRRTLVFKLGLILSNKLLRIISPLRPIASGLKTFDASIMFSNADIITFILLCRLQKLDLVWRQMGSVVPFILAGFA
ncbi:hypothetical protein PESHB4_09460 [Pediococcus ethanolidurans]